MRYAAGIEYDGSGFLGWQRLAEGETVQAAVEKALGFVVDHPLDVVCAGRTDSGVHARCQVVHFDTDAERTRYAARARRYRYTVLNRRVRPAMLRHYLTWERHPLDADAMHRAAQALVGEHDFSAFRTVHCQAKHARRNVHEISVRRDGEHVVIDVQANAFLHHMVRNFVGSLLLVGRGEQPGAWVADVLAGRDRTVAGPTAPSNGLVFLGPRYPRRWALPEDVAFDGD